MSCLLQSLCHVIFSRLLFPPRFSFFFFNDTATTEIYTLSLHDALPISVKSCWSTVNPELGLSPQLTTSLSASRSEEHTSELQSPCNLVCRLLLEKKKMKSRASSTYTNQSLDSQYCRAHHSSVDVCLNRY